MAALTFYLQDFATDSWQALDTSAFGAATLTTGWVVGTGSTNHSEMEQGVERASATFLTTTPPDGSLDGVLLFDAMRTVSPLTGDFASANWVADFVMRAITNGGAQDGRIRFRLFKADADGSNATEITSGHQQCSIVSNVSTSADFDSNLTFNPGAFSISNQYLFFQIAWERTGAGGMTNSDIHFRAGVSSTEGTRIVTSDFTTAESHSGTASLSGGGGVAFAESTQRNVAPSLAGGGSVAFADSTQRNAASSLAGGGSIAFIESTQRVAGPLLSGGGEIVFTEATQRGSSPVFSGGGGITADGSSAEAHSGSASMSGGGGVSVFFAGQHAVIVELRSGGGVAFSESTQRGLASILAAGGGIEVSHAGNKFVVSSLNGGGSIVVSETTGRALVAALIGGGVITADGTSSEQSNDREGTATLGAGGGIQTEHATARSGASFLTGGGGVSVVYAIPVRPMSVSVSGSSAGLSVVSGASASVVSSPFNVGVTNR